MNTTPGIVWPQRGKAVYQEDLDYEQSSKEAAIVNRTADHYSHGIQLGGEVSIAGAGMISVGPTLAYDSDGKRVQIPSTENVEVADGTWIVAVRHAWAMSDGVDPDLSGTSVQYRNDSYEIVLRAAAQPGDIPLRSVTFAAGIGTLGADLRSLRAMTVAGDAEVGGDLDVHGHATLHGGATIIGDPVYVDSENVRTKDNEIVLNEGESGAGITAGISGIRMKRGSLADALLRFVEADDRFYAGVDGALEKLAYLSEVYTKAQLDAFFEGESGGKLLVDWANIINKPASTTIGRLGIYIEPTSPVGVLYFHGTYPSRAAYAGLWDWVSARPSLIDDSNPAKFGTGDGSTTFRLPDWRGLGVRGAGVSGAYQMANGAYYDGGAVLAVLLDMMQGHWHSAGSNTSGTPSLAFATGYSENSNDRGKPAAPAQDPITDGTNGPIRSGPETRGVTVGIHWGISYE